MAKSKGRLLAELLASDGKVKESKSALDISGGKLAPSDIPVLPNSKLENSAITIAGESTALGGSVSLNTGHISEHTNFKYYTEARSRGSISAASGGGHGSVSYNASTGALSVTGVSTEAIQDVVGAMFSSNTESGITVTYDDADGTIDLSVTALNTGNVSEGSNLYHTTARARTSISATGSLSYNSTSGVMSFTMPAQNTGAITEGSNLYYTDARVQTYIGGSRSYGAITSTGAITSSAFFKATGSNLKFSAGGNHIFNVDLNGKIYPQTHNSADLGFSPTLAFRNLYLTNAARVGSLLIGANTVIDASRNHFGSQATFSGKTTMGGDGAIVQIANSTAADTSNTYTLAVGSQSGNKSILAARDINTSGGGYQINGTTVIDASRNLTNIGTISSGVITATQLNMVDSQQLRLGNSQDLKLYHTNNHSYIENVTGTLFIDGAQVTILDGSNVAAAFTPAGATTLYNAGNAKLVTTSAGITVTGTITGDITGSLSGTATQSSNLTNHNTGGLTEGSNLYYTDSRVGTYLSNNGYATQSTIVAAITDSAPGTLNTLNELAAALGDDASFSTTVTNSIATKLPLAGGTITGNLTVNNNLYIGDGDDGYFYNDQDGRTAFANGDFYIQDTVSNFYNYATHQYYGDSSGDNIHFRGNVLTGTNWIINPSDMRTRRYYSSDNTAYYTDPSETSVIKQILINGASNNSGKADFAVGAGGDPQVSWVSNQVQIGGADMNYNGKIHYGSNVFSMAGWDSNIDFSSQGGSTSRNIIFRPSNAGTSTERLTIHGDNGAVVASSQMRAPIFYDSDNTAYYTNPAGTSVFNGATFAATPTVNGNTILTSNAGINANNINAGTLNNDRLPNFVHLGNASGTGYSTDDGSWGSRLNVSSSVHAKIEVSQQANSMRSHWYAHTGNDSIKFGTSTSHDVEIQRGGTTRIEATSAGATITGIGTATTDFRAPIFYDSDNTGYHINPAGASKMSSIQLGGGTVPSISNSSVYLRVSTSDGRVDIGAGNSSYLHIMTDRPQFYFDKKIVVDTGNVGSYNEDLQLDRAGSSTARLRITSGTTISDQPLTVTGNVQHTGLTMTSGTDIDQIYSVTDSLTLSTSWQNTSINSSELQTGTYIVQVYVSDFAVGGGHYYEMYSGIMSWYGSATNSTGVDELPLHRAGHAANNGDFYMRTARHASGGNNLTVQVRGTTSNSGASNYIFKFRRMI